MQVLKNFIQSFFAISIFSAHKTQIITTNRLIASQKIKKTVNYEPEILCDSIIYLDNNIFSNTSISYLANTAFLDLRFYFINPLFNKAALTALAPNLGFESTSFP